MIQRLICYANHRDLKSTFLSSLSAPLGRWNKGSSILDPSVPTDQGLAFKSGFFLPSLPNPAAAATKPAFPAFSDEAILPLAATLIPGWRRVNWNQVGQTGADWRPTWKTWEKGREGMTGCDRQCHANRFPTNCSPCCLLPWWYPHYCTTPCFFQSQFFSPYILFRSVEPSRDDPYKCVGGADVDK